MLLIKRVLQYSTLMLSEEAILSMLWITSTDAPVDSSYRCFYHESWIFRTVSDKCFQITFISGNANHKSNDFFVSYFQFFQAFLQFWEVAVNGFSEISTKTYWRKTTWWCLCLLMLQRGVFRTQSNSENS